VLAIHNHDFISTARSEFSNRYHCVIILLTGNRILKDAFHLPDLLRYYIHTEIIWGVWILLFGCSSFEGLQGLSKGKHGRKACNSPSQRIQNIFEKRSWLPLHSTGSEIIKFIIQEYQTFYVRTVRSFWLSFHSSTTLPY
jgi:hypothetical protein